MSRRLDATIMVPTFNGEEHLESLIQMVFAQKTKYSYELLIIDSGSTDKTLEIIAQYPEIRLHEIPNSEFGHGRTRNLAASMANSEFILFLTQDAVPAHENWLNGMLEPFTLNSRIAGVFGKQIPRANCPPTIKREVATVFNNFGSDLSIMIQRRGDLIDSLNLQEASSFFSDVNSALRLDVWRKIPFRDVKYSEDMAFGEDILAAGYQKAYAPFGAVYHSNDLPLGQYFKRKFDEAYGLRMATGRTQAAPFKELVFGSLRGTIGDYLFIAKDKEYGLKRKLFGLVQAPSYQVALRRAIRKAGKVASHEEANKHSLEHQLKKKSKG